MFAVAEMGEFFTKVIGEEAILEIDDDLLCVPGNSDQGVHALQGMLANSILHENTARRGPTDLNQALRAIEAPSQRMSDLYRDERMTVDVMPEKLMPEKLMPEKLMPENDQRGEASYQPTPFLDQGMLSFYMHVDETEQSKLSFPITELIQDDELAPVPSIPVLH